MKKFDGLTHMRVEILIDPDTNEFQAEIDGTLPVIKGALQKLLEDLDNEELVNKLVSENEDDQEDDL